MNKKIIFGIILIALISSIGTIVGLAFALNFDGKTAGNLTRLIGAMRFIESQYVQELTAQLAEWCALWTTRTQFTLNRAFIIC